MSIYLPSPVRASRTASADYTYMQGAPFSKGAIVAAEHMVDGVYDLKIKCTCGWHLRTWRGYKWHMNQSHPGQPLQPDPRRFNKRTRQGLVRDEE